MNKNFAKITWIGLIAVACLSAQSSPLAMAKCSKIGRPGDKDEECRLNGVVESNSPKQQLNASPEVKHRKSAARKVLEGL